MGSVTKPMRRGTAVPLFALLSSAVLAMVLAAQTSLACTDKVAIPVPAAMPGMDMSAAPGALGQALMICPLVLALSAVSALLILGAVALLWRDPHRALTQRSIWLALARLPPSRTAVTVALAGGIAVAAMLWLDRSGPPALPICALLVAVLVLCSLTATAACIAFGRIAVALGRRVMLAIVAAIARTSASPAARCFEFADRIACSAGVCLLAAGRGLRAPPSFVR
jgi:hypothetical protein